ncbi:MAG: cryptochrome/photolyase family protein [Oscillatoriaceae bacterium SKYG93]|nr:cryptochrome/photolyase family protein [Oscillatoriaceae bacterium SKYG93]MDW8454060.1 cryptochrome/photolyase family protein [Oscillatoriaceae cyanobacterium SKYGB_i_bin93]
MTVGIWILGDQLSMTQTALARVIASLKKPPVILIESLRHAQKRPYHRQKLILIWSAMRHFAEELRRSGFPVTYATADDFETPLTAWVKKNGISEIQVMMPSDRPFFQYIQTLKLPCKITLLPNNQFLWSEEEFAQWAKKRKRFLMEDFYREGRRRFGILMAGDKPVGGKWNYDKENRQPPKGKKLKVPRAFWFEPDEITREVIQKVQSLSFPTYGNAEPFRWAVSREGALQVLDYFIEKRLPNFGYYQDAMIAGEETMWHSLISPYLNIGLLHPLEVIQAAERAFFEKRLPINSIEGFIRQILGWREYMRGLYIYLGAEYPEKNWFNHTEPLPDFFWNAEKTNMNCLRQVLIQVQQTGYAHHIQRLMVLSNFALIAGLNPQELENWFHAAFIDSYDWVMQTNVIGMGLFADGGILASKPYASSANYINRMSNYCQNCQFDWRDRLGENACPFNFLYWNFLERNRDKLKKQGRLSFILANLERMSSEELEIIRKKSTEYLRNFL